MAHNDNRKYNIQVSLSDEEYRQLTAEVRASGMSKTGYCRMKLLVDPTSATAAGPAHGELENRRRMKEYNAVFMPIGRTLNNAYMALKQNGVSEKTVAKLEIALEDFSVITKNFFK